MKGMLGRKNCRLKCWWSSLDIHIVMSWNVLDICHISWECLCCVKFYLNEICAGVSASNVTNSLLWRTLFWFWCIHDMCSRCYTSDVHVYTLTFKRLSQRDTKACFPAPKESASSVCSQEVTACFILLVYVANHLPARCFLSSLKRWQAGDANCTEGSL